MTNIKHYRYFHLIYHFILGGILTVKGYDKFHHHPVLGSIIFLFGITIFGYCFWVLASKKNSQVLSIVFHLFEALVMLFTAYIFYTEGKKYLVYISLLAATGFFISVIVGYKHYKAKKLLH